MDNETGPPWEQLGPAGAFCIAVNNAGGSAGEGAVAGVNAGVVVESAAPIDGDAGAFCGIGEDNTAGAPMEVTNPNETEITGGSSGCWGVFYWRSHC